MWLVAKIKTKDINLFKKNLVEKFGKETKFYAPKVLFSHSLKNKLKQFDKLVLENYIFCYHEKFNNSYIINTLQYTKGLQYFLNGYLESQKEIEKFIFYCKSFENKNGYLKPLFFKKVLKDKGQFTTGPFSNLMFEIIEKQKNKLKILVGNFVTTVSDNKNYLYRSV